MSLVPKRKIHFYVLGSVSLVDEIIQSIIVLWGEVEPTVEY